MACEPILVRLRILWSTSSSIIPSTEVTQRSSIATGSSCGITWLMGGNYNQVAFAVQNMIANLTGMICDGAKPSCALKVTTGVSTAVLSAMMAMEDSCVTSVEGIIDEDVDRRPKLCLIYITVRWGETTIRLPSPFKT